MFEKRFVRQSDLVPGDKIKLVDISIIGVGAIGRQVAIQAAAIGVPIIHLTDFDSVEEENLAPQGFLESDMGKSKVNAVADFCSKINSSVKIIKNNKKFKNSEFIDTSVIFCCVDSIETRKQIFNSVGKRCQLFIDGRMAAESGRIYSTFDDQSREKYLTKIFPPEEAFRGSCTAKSTIYNSNMMAGLMISQLTKWLRGIPLDFEISINILTNEMSAMGS